MTHTLLLIVVIGALFGAPLFSQTTTALDPIIKEGQLKWWSLTETPAQVAAVAGSPSMVAEFEGYLSWQHRLPEIDHESDVSSQMLFRRDTGKLVSVTRSYETDIDVTAFFPAAETTLHCFPDTGHPTFRALVRRLGDGRFLVASGLASGEGKRTAQLVLVREEELARFFPWIHLKKR